MKYNSKLPRRLQIIFVFTGFARAWWRLRKKAPQLLPKQFRFMLEQLGTTFVKLGQGLSLRRDVLPAGYRNELENLQYHAPAFNSDLAIADIESAFGKTMKAHGVRTGAPLPRQWILSGD